MLRLPELRLFGLCMIPALFFETAGVVGYNQKSEQCFARLLRPEYPYRFHSVPAFFLLTSVRVNGDVVPSIPGRFRA